MGFIDQIVKDHAGTICEPDEQIERDKFVGDRADSPTAGSSIDAFGRTVDYLRVSVTDRCNERCLYCMPEGYKGWAQRDDHLSADEIVRSVEAATVLGFRKFRVTGGEPLIRRDILEILERIWALPGTQTLGLSTNGTRVAALAESLKRAGVRSLNVSLDALEPATYRAITGGDVVQVLAGIDAAAAEGFEIIKLNCVLLRGLNETEFEPLIAYAGERNLPLRFIELMPLTQGNVLSDPRFLPVHELLGRLSRRGRLEALRDYRPGNGPARYYEFNAAWLSHPATLGFIGALTTEHFCATCNKLRLTADGKLRPCLGRHGEIDLRSILRGGGDIAGAFQEAVANKPESHEFLSTYNPGRPMIAIGG
ncbi:MAG: GTP 3',8-cyclase MoaA [Chthoniobacterales bacterium]|nr:GTP 3',8-cyclase MoaA [Chthoniobacterales bacterium]